MARDHAMFLFDDAFRELLAYTREARLQDRELKNAATRQAIRACEDLAASFSSVETEMRRDLAVLTAVRSDPQAFDEHLRSVRVREVYWRATDDGLCQPLRAAMRELDRVGANDETLRMMIHQLTSVRGGFMMRLQEFVLHTFRPREDPLMLLSDIREALAVVRQLRTAAVAVLEDPPRITMAPDEDRRWLRP